MNNISENYVTSYLNPDTDGVACAIAMAQLLTNIDNTNWMPVIFGRISDETRFVLQELYISEPKIIESLSNILSIVLVDTHHKAQLPYDFPFEKVVKIIDHHPNGDNNLFPNAKIVNESVGAAASIVADMFFKKGLIDKNTLALLGFAILSNTLYFTAPSTSDFDRDIYAKIIKEVEISSSSIEGMFEKRSLVLKNDMYSALCSDFKVFETKRGIVGISQIEAYNLKSLIDIAQTVLALQRITEEKQIKYCLFNGVDIKTQKSIVVCANSESQELLCSIFHLQNCGVSQIFDKILLRKTDFIPPLNSEES